MANPALVKMLGYDSFEELSRLNLEREGFDKSMPRSIFKQRVEKEGKVLGLESLWLRRDGSRLFVSESAFAVKDEAGNTLYYEGTAQNITKRKEAEEKLIHHQQHLRTLASELSLAEERLRRKIATDLHDNISQNLAISKMKLESLAAGAEPQLASRLKEITDLVGQTIEVSRTLTFEMSPPVLYELGFEAAVGWLVNQTRQRFAIETEFIDDGSRKALSDDVKVLLFQAVRELLTNIVKHARAKKVEVMTQTVQNHVRITVEDDGVGFNVSRKRGGFGLFNIRERLDLLGGSVEIHSSPGRGTQVMLQAPLIEFSSRVLKSRKKTVKLKKSKQSISAAAGKKAKVKRKKNK